MKKILAIIFCISSHLLIYSQKEGDIDPVEIKIVKDYNVFIEEATKINTPIQYHPQFKDNSSKRKIEYQLPDRIEQFKFEPTSIEPIAYKTKEFFYQNTNFFRIGMGSILNPIVEWSHIKQSPKNMMKIYLIHHSAWKSDDTFQKYSETKFSASINRKLGRWDLIPQIALNQKYYNFYGNIPESIYQNEARRSYTNGDFSLALNREKSEVKSLSIQNKWNIMAGFDQLTQISNLKSNNELQTGFKSILTYRYSEKTNISLEGGAEYYTLKWDTFTDKWFINIYPSVEYKSKALKLTGGLNVVQTLINSKDILYILPKLESEIQVIPNYLNFYSAWERKIEFNTLQSSLQINPFAQYDKTFLPNTKIENRSAGIKGTIAGITYQSFFTQKIMKDVILFKNDDINPRFMSPVYEKNMTQNNVSLELSYLKLKKLSTYLKGDIFLYEMDNTPVAYNLPSQRLSFGVHYVATPKLNLTFHSFILGGVKSIIAGNQIKKPMAFDMNLGGEYLISKNFYIFANLNNILNAQITPQIGYQSYGINGQGGLRFIYK